MSWVGNDRGADGRSAVVGRDPRRTTDLQVEMNDRLLAIESALPIHVCISRRMFELPIRTTRVPKFVRWMRFDRARSGKRKNVQAVHARVSTTRPLPPIGRTLPASGAGAASESKLGPGIPVFLKRTLHDRIHGPATGPTDRLRAPTMLAKPQALPDQHGECGEYRMPRHATTHQRSSCGSMCCRTGLKPMPTSRSTARRYDLWQCKTGVNAPVREGQRQVSPAATGCLRSAGSSSNELQAGTVEIVRRLRTTSSTAVEIVWIKSS